MGTIVRAFFAVACAAVGFFVASRMRSSSASGRGPARIVHEPTPLYIEPPRDKQLRTTGILAGSSIVAGALIALFVSVAVAFVVGTVTGLLK